MATGDSIKTDILSDETVDLLCRVCKRKGIHREAETYCVECQDWFCLTCVKVHEDIPSLTGHKILDHIIDKSQFPSESVKIQGSRNTLPHAPDERCEIHTRNYIDMATVNAEHRETLIQVKGSKKYCVEIQSDVDNCDIARTLEDGTILLSDNNNKKVKRLDGSTYIVIDYCDLPAEPWQICSVNKHLAAVTLPDQQEVHFISLSNRMILTTKITTDFDCYGLAHAGDNLCISDRYTSIYIYSASGRKLKQFSKNQSGMKLFSDIRSLAVNEDGSRIYVADCDKGLIVLDNNGNVVGNFDGPQLRSAYDSCLIGRGSLLVCGDNSHNVLQFGLDGELIGEVVKFDDADAYHQAICWNPQMSEMILGRLENNIEVYML